MGRKGGGQKGSEDVMRCDGRVIMTKTAETPSGGGVSFVGSAGVCARIEHPRLLRVYFVCAASREQGLCGSEKGRRCGFSERDCTYMIPPSMRKEAALASERTQGREALIGSTRDRSGNM